MLQGNYILRYFSINDGLDIALRFLAVPLPYRDALLNL